MYAVKVLIQGSALTTTAASYYSAPTGTSTRVTQMSVTNTDNAPHIISLYISPSTSAPTTTDLIVVDKTLQPKESWVPYQAQGVVLAPGCAIQAKADANAVVVIKASGIELTT